MSTITTESNAQNIVMIHDGRFKGKLGTLIPQQVIQLEQVNNYGCDITEVLTALTQQNLLNQNSNDELEFLDFINQYKRFKVSARNIDSLFDSASKVTTLYLYRLQNLGYKRFQEDLYNKNSYSVQIIERLPYVMFIYLMTNVMLEGQQVKAETEVKDSISTALKHISVLYETAIYDSTGLRTRSLGRNYPEDITESLYAQILPDQHVNKNVIEDLVSADSRFTNGYEVIGKIFEAKHNAYPHGNRSQKAEITLKTTTLGSFDSDKKYVFNNNLSNILKIKQVLLELRNLEKLRNSFDGIDDIVVDQYKKQLLELNYSK